MIAAAAAAAAYPKPVAPVAPVAHDRGWWLLLPLLLPLPLLLLLLLLGLLLPLLPVLISRGRGGRAAAANRAREQIRESFRERMVSVGGWWW